MNTHHDGPTTNAGTGPKAREPETAGRVWLCAQRSLHAQRAGRFTPESIAHPARMQPDLAAAVIETYSRPGDWVLDPMCGIGTTLVQAVRAGRRAVGVELEPRWVRVAGENLDLARADGHTMPARVVRGDARHLPELLRAEIADGVAPSLVLTSPPYGAAVHGHITHHAPTEPIVKIHHRYAATRTRANLAHTTSPGRLAAAMTDILRAAAAVVAPGGHVVLVVRPWRRDGVLIDLPGQMTACAQAVGLVPVDRAVGLLARIDDPTPQAGADPGSGHVGPRLVARSSFFQRLHVTRARAAGIPMHLIAHEDVLILQRMPTVESSGGRCASPTDSPSAVHDVGDDRAAQNRAERDRAVRDRRSR